MGWYFSSVPENKIVPATQEELAGVSIADSNSECGCTCEPPSCPPHPHPPQDQQLARAAISVNTLAERNALNNNKLLPNGKLVRVNECPDGTSHYFVWNQVTESWEEETFGAAGSDSYTKEEADSRFITKDDCKEEIASQLAEINIPEQVRTTVMTDPYVKVTIETSAKQAVQADMQSVKDQVEGLAEEVELINSTLGNSGWEHIKQTI